MRFPRTVAGRLLLLLLPALMWSCAAAGGKEARDNIRWLMNKTAQDVFSDPKAAALAAAAERGDVAEMEALVKVGADINAKGTNGITPLIWSVASESKAGTQKLLQLGAYPNRKADNGESAISLAAGGNDPEVLEMLLKAGGDPNIRGNVNSALEVAVSRAWRDLDLRKQMVGILLKYGADINQAGKLRSITAATAAAGLNQFDMVAFLLEKGYNFDLVGLARFVDASQVSEGSPLYQWKLLVLAMLKDRGVQFPLPPLEK